MRTLTGKRELFCQLILKGAEQGVALFLVEKQRRGVRKVAVFVRFDKVTGRMTSIDTRYADDQQGTQDTSSIDNTQAPF